MDLLCHLGPNWALKRARTEVKGPIGMGSRTIP